MKTLCNAVFNSITVYPDGKIAPCCTYDPTMLRNIGTYDGVNTFSDLQQIMANGEFPAGCKVCKRDSEEGVFAYRNHYGVDESKQDLIRYLDIRNNNTCNLACRFCGPYFSSTWTKLTTGINIENFDVWPLIDTVDLSQLREIYFTGGEPMLNPTHWQLLKKLVTKGHSKNVSLRYNTNLTLLSNKGNEVIELWKHFKKVCVFGSLESTGDSLSAIRSGAKWEVINDNVDTLISYKTIIDIDIRVFATVGLLNYWFLQDLIDWCNLKDITLELLKLQNPDVLALDSLPEKLKYLIDSTHINLRGTADSEHNQRIIKQCKSAVGSTEPLFMSSVAHILLMDKLRGENLFDMMPFASVVKKQLLTNG